MPTQGSWRPFVTISVSLPSRSIVGTGVRIELVGLNAIRTRPGAASSTPFTALIDIIAAKVSDGGGSAPSTAHSTTAPSESPAFRTASSRAAQRSAAAASGQKKGLASIWSASKPAIGSPPISTT